MNPLNTRYWKRLTSLLLIATIPACDSATKPPFARTRESETVRIPKPAEPEKPKVIQGLPINQAMKTLIEIVRKRGAEDQSKSPVAIGSFQDTAQVRTALDGYLEERLIEALAAGGFQLVPRSDNLQPFIDAIGESQAGYADLQSRMEHGQLRMPKMLVNGTTVKLKSHIELAIKIHRIEDSTLSLTARVEISWDDNLRELANTRLISRQEALSGNLPAPSPNQPQRVLIEGDPLGLSYSMEAIARDAQGRKTRQPLRDGDTLHSRDSFAIYLKPGRDAYVYGILVSSDGSAVSIFPHHEIELGNKVQGGKQYRIPDQDAIGKDQWYVLDDNTGTETIYLLASDEPLTNIQKLVADLKRPAGTAGPAMSKRIIRQMKAVESRSVLKNRYVSRPGSKGILPRLGSGDAPPANDPSLGEDNAALQQIEGLGCLVKTIRIEHR